MPVTISRYSIGNDRGARSTRPAARAETTRTPAIRPKAVSSSNIDSYDLRRTQSSSPG